MGGVYVNEERMYPNDTMAIMPPSNTTNVQSTGIRAIEYNKGMAKAVAKGQGGYGSQDGKMRRQIGNSHNEWKDMHERDAKVIAADNSKWDNDKINKQRAEIKAV